MSRKWCRGAEMLSGASPVEFEMTEFADKLGGRNEDKEYLAMKLFSN